MPEKMSSFERVLCTLSHKEPDRVPLFLLFSMYGAKELGIPVKEYFSNADNVVKAQLLMRKKYETDCLYTFFYGPAEIEAWQGEVIFADKGPPNSGEPFINKIDQIDSLKVPELDTVPVLMRVLEATEKLKKVSPDVPIIGVVMSPFSLPVMQMGFDKYLEILYFNRPAFDRLMAVNEEFCNLWANAQLEAGASAICYFDPLASPEIIERSLYLETGYKTAARTVKKIKGPVATHLASARALPVIDDIISTGSGIIGIGSNENIEEIKKKSKGRITLLGNLNGVAMSDWDSKAAESNVKQIMAGAASGGGFILSDSHGEIPWQVPEDVLLGISDAARKWGSYPLNPDR